MTRPITFAVEEYYHLYNRGTEKRKIFLGQKDYQRFIALLYLCNGANNVHLSNVSQGSRNQGRTLLDVDVFELDRGEPLVDICTYCLMPNHFHLLVREKTEDGISKFMQKLLTAYTMFFNKKYERTGALFQGKFKAKHVAQDAYLTYVIAYIHLNPVKLIEPHWKETGIKQKAKAERFIRDYGFSSYLDFIEKHKKRRPESKIVNLEALPDYFETVKDFESLIHDWLTYKESVELKIKV